MEPSELIRIIALDDHPIVLEGIGMMLRDHPEIELVSTFDTASDAVGHVKNHPVDVVLVDIHMPDTNGIECTRAMLKIKPGLKVIALTMVSEISLIKRMLEAGASGYLLKSANRNEMVRAIKAVHSGKEYLSDEVTQRVISDFIGTSRAFSSNSLPKLTRRETDVLRLIVDEKTTSEIAETLSISFGTVETHRRNMMSKLGVRNTAGLVRLAIEHALV